MNKYEQLTLFPLEAVEWVYPTNQIADPYWEELEKGDYSLTDENLDIKPDLAVSEYPHNKVSEYIAEGVNIYSPGGTAAKNQKYFRCSCKQGTKTRHIHIPGGCIASGVAQKNAEIVRRAFASGTRSYHQIKALVRSLPKVK